MLKQYKIGLALSGGGAKGIAHLGIIKAMEEFGIKPEIISGVSAGAIMGALYADGNTPDDICKWLKSTKFFNYVKLVIPRRGFMDAQRFYDMLDTEIKAKTFEELKMPLIINATNLVDGKNEFFSSGPLIERVVASASVPGALTPRVINGKPYVDGGVFNNMPCSVIRPYCQYLIGCHVNPIVKDEKMDGILEILNRVYDLSIQSSTVAEKAVCDLVLEPKEARNFGIFDIDHTQQIFDIGYSFAKKVFTETAEEFAKFRH